MLKTRIGLTMGCLLVPTIAAAEPQFTAADIIKHFAKQTVTEESAAADEGGGVVVNGREASIAKPSFRGVTTAGDAARVKPIILDDGLVIPLTGAGRKTAISDATATAPTMTAAAAPAPAETAPKTRAVNSGYDLLITFELASAQLTLQAERNLREFAVALQSPALAGFNFAVEGHTDASGSAAKNMKLSEQRAASVVSFLTRLGVQGQRLSPKGFGETRPLKTNPEDPGNRRVETRRLN